MESENSFSEIVNSSEGLHSSVFVVVFEIKNEGFNALFCVKRDGKCYFLKALKPEFRGNTFYEGLLRKEYELGVVLEHKNIAQTFAFEYDEQFGNFILQEYVDGRTLTEFLRENPSVSQRKKIFLELLDACEYFHAKQIVHRDIKPSNLLVSANGNNLKIIDFGFSDSDSYTVLKQPAGTVKYAAPEQFDANVQIDCRADIYAVGLLLAKIFPKKYGRIVRKCTSVSRDDRYANIYELREALRGRNKTAVWLLLLLLLSLVAIVTFIVARRRIPAETVHIQVDTLRQVRVDTLIVEKSISASANEKSSATATSSQQPTLQKHTEPLAEEKTTTEPLSKSAVSTKRTPSKIERITQAQYDSLYAIIYNVYKVEKTISRDSFLTVYTTLQSRLRGVKIDKTVMYGEPTPPKSAPTLTPMERACYVRLEPLAKKCRQKMDKVSSMQDKNECIKHYAEQFVELQKELDDTCTTRQSHIDLQGAFYKALNKACNEILTPEKSFQFVYERSPRIFVDWRCEFVPDHKPHSTSQVCGRYYLCDFKVRQYVVVY